MLDPACRRTWADISLHQIRDNFRALRALAGDDAEVAAVVKADAYGHGLLPVARTCAAAGATRFAVATLDEALALRRGGIAAGILILAPLLPDEAPEVVRANLTPAISSEEFFAAFAAAAGKAPFPARCFLALDTGMGREGMAEAQALRLLERAPAALRIHGLSTHLAGADEDDPAPTEAQLDVFAAALARLPLPPDAVASFANSPGMLRFGRTFGRRILLRPGLLLYGIEPWPGALDATPLRPALTWRARVTLVRNLPAGATVGYGRTAILSRPSRVATVAAGYGDGLSRRLSNAGQVLLQGVRCPMIGRVSMDQCQVDATDLPGVAIGDVATLIGEEGAERITAYEMAETAGTTCHEPTTALTRRVPRRYGL